MKIKRFLAIILTLALTAGIIPVGAVNAVENLSFVQIEDTAYGVLDTDVKAKKITLSDGYSFVTHNMDFDDQWSNYGEGYAIVSDNSTYYLVGTEGVVKSFYTDDGTEPTLTRIFDYSLKTPYAVYRVKNPETGKYDVFNANTCEYFEYNADDIFAFKNMSYTGESDYAHTLIRVEIDGKYGVLNNKGQMIYQANYIDINTYGNCLMGKIESYSYAILTADGSSDGSRSFYTYETLDKYVLAVQEKTEPYNWAAVSKKNGSVATDFLYDKIQLAESNGFYYVVGAKSYEAVDMYGFTETYYLHDVITESGKVLDVCAEFGCVSSSVGIYNSSVSVGENALAVYITDDYGYYDRNGTGAIDGSVVKPEFNRKYVIVSPSLQNVYYETAERDDRWDNFAGHYGKAEFANNSGYYLYDSSYNQICRVYKSNNKADIKELENHIIVNDYNAGYMLYDTVNDKVVFQDKTDLIYDTYDKSAVIVPNDDNTKFGVYNLKTGEFSDYIFDGTCDYVETFTSDSRTMWVCYNGEKYLYINDKFKVIAEAEDTDSVGSLFAVENNLLRIDSGDFYMDHYDLSILDYDGNVKSSIYSETDVLYMTEAFNTAENYSYGLVNTDGRVILDNISDGTGITKNGLTYVVKNDYASIIDKYGQALIYGNFDIDDYRDEYLTVGHSGFASFVKDGAVYIYDFTDCYGYDENTDSSVVTEDALFGEYNSFLNNGYYSSMTDNAEEQIATVLSRYGENARVIAFAKSALDGQTGYVLKKLVELIPAVDINEAKLYQEMALEYISNLDTSTVSSFLKAESDALKIVKKINETQKAISDIKSEKSKLKFIGIWEDTDGLKEAELYKVLTEVEKHQDKLDKYLKNTGRAITTLEFVVTYLTIYMLQDGLVERLMELVPSNSELYSGLSYIHLKQQKYGVAGMVAEMLTDEVFDLVADTIDESLLALANVKNATLVGIILEIGGKIASSAIDSPTLDDIDKAVLAFANVITLKKAVENYRTVISENYQNNGDKDIETLKTDYSLLTSTYYKSLFSGLTYTQKIADDSEKVRIDSSISQAERKLIYRSYIKTCLLNARTQWEYTVEANKAVISKLKAEYPVGEGRVLLTDLYENGYEFGDTVAAPVKYAIDVPQTIDGYQVSGIETGAVSDNRVTGVYVPDTVTDIKDGAFSNCEALDSVFIGTENENAFDNCENLDVINIAEKSVESIEIISEAESKTVEMQGEIDTTGLVIKVTYTDGTTETVESDFYAEISDRKVGENTVSVFYGGGKVEYAVDIPESECSYSVSYQDETGNQLAETITGTATAGSGITLEIPAIDGYTPVVSQQSETIGQYNDFVVKYVENPKTSVDNATVTVADQDFAYKNLTPKVKVKLDGNVLTQDVDYTVSYSDNYYAGTATVIVLGIGEYDGMVTGSFEIIEKAHDWSDWIVEYEPDVYYPGYKYRVCACCNEYQEKYFYDENHQHLEYLAEKTPATYFAKGKETYRCEYCDEITRTKTIKKLVLAKPKVTVKGGKKKITVTYKKVKKAKGFQVRYTIGKKTKDKNFATKKNVTKSISKLKKGNYKVTVRAYIKSGKKTAYGKWSKSVTVKVK